MIRLKFIKKIKGRGLQLFEDNPPSQIDKHYVYHQQIYGNVITNLIHYNFFHILWMPNRKHYE